MILLFLINIFFPYKISPRHRIPLILSHPWIYSPRFSHWIWLSPPNQPKPHQIFSILPWKTKTKTAHKCKVRHIPKHIRQKGCAHAHFSFYVKNCSPSILVGFCPDGKAGSFCIKTILSKPWKRFKIMLWKLVLHQFWLDFVRTERLEVKRNFLLPSHWRKHCGSCHKFSTLDKLKTRKNCALSSPLKEKLRLLSHVFKKPKMKIKYKRLKFQRNIVEVVTRF